jgi:hypothetical protein
MPGTLSKEALLLKQKAAYPGTTAHFCVEVESFSDL